MNAAINFGLAVLAVLCLLVYVDQLPQKYDAGYVYQADPRCWEEPTGCMARSMYPAGY